MAGARETLYRFQNGIRKVLSGLRPFSESVWPGVRNDLFVAHESIYRFAARYAKSASVLDAGCGTGYGSRILRESGASSVVGVDIDPANIRYARKRYGSSARFEVGDIEKLDQPPGSFDLVTASNSLEHLHAPSGFLTRVFAVLRPEGKAILAVPPIYSRADLDVHAGIHYHRSNLTIQQWIDLVEKGGFLLECFSHRAREGVSPDFSSHLPTRLCTDDFLFDQVSRETLRTRPTITAIFVAEKQR